MQSLERSKLEVQSLPNIAQEFRRRKKKVGAS